MSLRPFESHSPSLAEGAWVDESAVVIGDVKIGKDSSIWPLCVLRGDIHRIRIGERSNIQDGSILHVTHASDYHPAGFAVSVGNDVIVGHKVMLHGCTIEDGCLVGMGSVVLDGAVVKAGAMIGAGSVVPPGKELEGGYLWLGSPVRRVRALSDDERAHLKYSAAHYVRLKSRHQQS